MKSAYIAGGFLFFFALAIIKGPVAWHGVKVNKWAVQVTYTCLGAEQAERLESVMSITGDTEAQMSWLTGQLAHCQLRDDEAVVAWQQTLEASSERLALVRTAAPHNLALAQFATAQYPDQAEPFFWLGDVYLAQNDNSKAVRSYETGLMLQPDRGANAWMSVGRLYETEGEWERAAYAYDQACYYVDQGKNGCPNAGRLYFDHQQYDLAAQRYREAMKQLPYWQPARLELARTLLQLGQREEAQMHLTHLANEGNRAAQALLDQLTEN